MMTEMEWRPFLEELSEVLLAHDHTRTVFTETQHATGYLGYAGATEEQIVAAETRLDKTLPPSYRAFLKVSNGFPQMSYSVEPGRLWSVEELFWIRNNDPHYIRLWGEEGRDEIEPEEHAQDRTNAIFYRAEYVDGLLSISDHGDACDLLLSPEVVNESGEWECWKIANWYPGAARWESFTEWMQHVLIFHQVKLDS